MRDLSLGHVPRKDLASCFCELRPFLEKCRFKSCSHLSEPEPDCAVKAAIARGDVTRERYESCVRFCEELDG